MRANTSGMDVSEIGGYTWESQKKGCPHILATLPVIDRPVDSAHAPTRCC
jgi:hypothetical protein